MTSYLLSVHAVDDSRAGVQPQRGPGGGTGADVRAFTDALERDGALVCGGGLRPAREASLVSLAFGAPSATSGPAVAGPEQLAAFWVIDVEEHRDAVAWAGLAAAACRHPVELREISGSSTRTAAGSLVGAPAR